MYVMHPSFWGKLIIYFQSKIKLIELGCLCNWLNYTQKKKKKKKKKCWVCATHGFHPTLDVIAHLMRLSLKSSCQPCLLTRFDIKCVGHAEVKACFVCLHLLWLDAKHVEGRKEGKDDEIKVGYSAIWCTRRKEEWRGEAPVSETKDSAILEICCVSERKQKRREN